MSPVHDLIELSRVETTSYRRERHACAPHRFRDAPPPPELRRGDTAGTPLRLPAHGLRPRYRCSSARRILKYDFSYAVILAADGRLMDGGHRLARAWLEGRTEVTAQRFETNLEPDYVETPVPATTESAR